MTRIALLILALSIAVSSCSSTSPSGMAVASCAGGTATGTFTATVDGTNFVATCLLAASSANGIVALGATNIASGNASSYIDITFALQLNGTSLGPYTFTGVTTPPNANNGQVNVGGSQFWNVGGIAAGSSGMVTFTTLTATRAVGKFSFTLTPSSGATGTKTVTNGSFDLTF